VRPTSDRLRETLFNVIAPRIEGASFLDVCAGSGAVGIEALSRGASHVTFVDQSRRMCALIEANLNLCKIAEEETQVVQAETIEFIRRILHPSAARSKKPANRTAPWDIVFFDPPYNTDYLPILKTFGAHASSLLSENGLLIVEHHHKNELKDEAGSIIRSRILKQGDSALSFYRPTE
jgi:16S rRNA (guanine(966)-N(2))-methyltransferase RsmD